MDPAFLTSWNVGQMQHQDSREIDDSSVRNRLHDIAKRNGWNYAGCWDVVAWNGDGDIHFFESKRKSHDSMRQTQVMWLLSALAVGLSIEDFTVVRWSFREPARTPNQLPRLVQLPMRLM